jgi:23S rRNA pseudouridine1911/1915/1917 synthase
VNPQVLFEDNSVLVIDKPAGLVVNRAESVKEPTLQDWLEKNYPIDQSIKDTDFGKRNGFVHRIDKETSGCLIIAKTPEAFIELQRQFHDREIEKSYLSLVHGIPQMKSGKIVAEVGRLPWNRERFGILSGGRPSETTWNLIEAFDPTSLKLRGAGEKYALIEWHPKTGRTHQIRVHAKYIHHPLVADTFYAGRKTSRRDREWCPRLFLHAAKITFTHPESGKRITVESQLPEDLKQVLDKIKN